jgi:hypothetical protein
MLIFALSNGIKLLLIDPLDRASAARTGILPFGKGRHAGHILSARSTPHGVWIGRIWR